MRGETAMDNTPRHPWWLLVGLMGGLVVVLGVTGTLAYLAGVTGYAPLAFGLAPIALALVVGLSLRRAWRPLGFCAVRGTKAALIATVSVGILPLSAVAVSAGFGVSAGGAAGFIALAVLVGFVEETIFRGILLRAFSARGSVAANLITSTAFAAAHTITAISPDADSGQVARTVAFAFLFGIVAALLTDTTGSIWPAIILHASFDSVGFILTPRSPVLTDLVSIGVCAALAVLLANLRRLAPAAATPTPDR